MPRFRIFMIAFAILLLSAEFAYARVPTMTVSELTPGLKGIGRTVIKGTTVEEFNVEIVGVVKKGGFTGGPMILVKCTGPVIDATGGVAGGYSGSPVFIAGKLVGAISAAWFFADHSIAGVTPIDEMLKNFYFDNEPKGEIKVARLDQPVELFGRKIDSATLSMSSKSTEILENKLGNNTIVLTACKTPLFVNGLSPELVEKVKEYLGPRLPYVDIMAGIGSGMASGGYGKVSIANGPTEFEPGSAMGMQLVTGDIDLTAVGTVTYVDPSDPEKKILAFGHPFLMRGRVDAPLTSARIVFTMPAMDRSFKIGEAIDVIGTSYQDRGCAVSGFLGKMPDLVKVHFEINDLDQNRQKKYECGVLRDEDLLPFLALTPVLQGLSETMNRQGPSTAKVSFTVKGEGLADPIKRENMYYSDYSSFDLITELLEAMSIVTTSNIFREVKINDIDIKIELTQNRQTLDIVEIKFPDEGKKAEEQPAAAEKPVPEKNAEKPKGTTTRHNPVSDDAAQAQPAAGENPNVTVQPVPISRQIKNFKPGDTIKIKVVLKPYRDESYEEILQLKIPEDINPGMTQLVVRGGGGLPNRFMMGGGMIAMMNIQPAQIPGGMPMMPMEKPPKSLDEVIQKFLERDHNNELVVEFMPPMNPVPQSDADKDTPPKPIKDVQSKGKVIFGTFQLPIEIKKPEEAKPKEGDVKASDKNAKPTDDKNSQDGKEKKDKKSQSGKRRDFRYRDN